MVVNTDLNMLSVLQYAGVCVCCLCGCCIFRVVAHHRGICCPVTPVVVFVRAVERLEIEHILGKLCDSVSLCWFALPAVEAFTLQPLLDIVNP